MGRMYSVAVPGVGHSSPQDILTIFAGSRALRLRQFAINSYDSTSNKSLDLGIAIHSGTITPGTGGQARTPQPLRSTDPTASFTARSSDTVQMSSTISNILVSYGANVEIGWEYTPPEDLCIVIQPGEAISIGGGTGTGSVDISFFAIIEELS